jgi:uncharacterized RDD family membrane protein YckC
LPDYAGFWARALAFVLDGVIVTVIVVPILVLGFGIREVSLDPAEASWDLVLFLALAAAVIGFWRAFGATPGKLALERRAPVARPAGAAFPRLLRLRVPALPRISLGGARPPQAGLAR